MRIDCFSRVFAHAGESPPGTWVVMILTTSGSHVLDAHLRIYACCYAVFGVSVAAWVPVVITRVLFC